jgi:hypothetical protein
MNTENKSICFVCNSVSKIIRDNQVCITDDNGRIGVVCDACAYTKTVSEILEAAREFYEKEN